MLTEQNMQEACFYYRGLPSNPRLIARSSAATIPWIMPTGPEAYPVRKKLRVVGNHALGDGVWEDKLAPPFLAILDSEGVMWTSVDVVRIVDEKKSSGPVILWVGVKPESLTPADGLAVALKCKDLLEQEGIHDVHVELRESVVTRCAGPRYLVSPYSDRDPIVEVGRPLTCTLGLSICAASTGWVEGTGGFYMAEGGDSKKIFLVTARHILFPPDVDDNEKYEHGKANTSQPRRNVLLLSDVAFQRLRKSVQDAISSADFQIDFQKRRVEMFDGKEGRGVEEARKAAQTKLVEEERALEERGVFYKDGLKHWSTCENRVLGHVVFSPPISFDVGAGRHTEDFAIVEMDTSKLDTGNFQGNVIDLGTLIDLGKFIQLMQPYEFSCTLTKCELEYPLDRLLPLSGVVSLQEMRHPTTLDKNGEPCMMVLKRGPATGLTIGRANNIASFVRNYSDDDDKEPQISMEWSIFPLDEEYGAFSEEGDSGAVIVTGFGKMVALLTGNAGVASRPDITYGTPIEFLLERIAEQFPKAHLYPPRSRSFELAYSALSSSRVQWKATN